MYQPFCPFERFKLKTNTYRKYKKPGQPINGKQITIIKMAQGQLNIDDETYRDMLEERYGKRSCTKLTYDQASAFIRELEGKGFAIIANKAKKPLPRVEQPKRPPIPRGGNVVALANQDELDKVNKIAALITWRVENGLALFLEKRMGIKRGKVRTSEEAYLAIEGLKKMFANQMKAQYGESWWTLKFDHEGISEFIRLHKPAEWR
jgi:hypothetical protein